MEDSNHGNLRQTSGSWITMEIGLEGQKKERANEGEERERRERERETLSLSLSHPIFLVA